MFPRELILLPRWVGYRSVQEKAPLSCRKQNMPASSTNPATWVPFYEAKRNHKKFNYHGVGFVLCPPYVGVDIDDCVDTAGQLSPYARDLVERLDSYTEYSPSRTGIHIICRGTIPRAYKDNSKGLEIYNTARYFTVTEDVIRPRYGKLPDRTASLRALIPDASQLKSQKQKGWISESLKALQPGNFHNQYVKIIGRLHYDRWAAEDIYTLLEPHALRCGSDLLSLKTRIQSIVRYPQVLDQTDEFFERNANTVLRQNFKREWVIEPFFPRRKICVIDGIQETGKSWLLLDLAIEASRGGRWLETFSVHKEKVLYIDQERSEDETGARVKQLCAAKKLDALDNLTFFMGSSIRLNLDQSFAAFKKKLQQDKYTLVLVDSLVRFHTVDDNSRQGVLPVLERLHQLRNEFGITFVLLEHEGKNILSPEKRKEEPNALDMMGSSAKPQVVESVLTVRSRGDKLGQVFHTKATCGSKAESFKFEIVDVAKNATIVRVI